MDKIELPFERKDEAARLAQACVKVVRKWPAGCEEKYLYTALHVNLAARGSHATMEQIDAFVRLVEKSGLLVRRGDRLFAAAAAEPPPSAE